MSNTEEYVIEAERLQRQVTELQASMSTMVNNTLARRVRAFMVAIKHPVLHTPQVPPEDRVRLRLRLIAEEFIELLDASFAGEGSFADRLGEDLKLVIDRGHVKVNLVEFADALADIDYVVEGARAEFGINGGPVADEVHRSNMAKFWPCDVCGVAPCLGCKGGKPTMVVREDGKVLKPAGWTPPDIVAVLQAQGWRSKLKGWDEAAQHVQEDEERAGVGLPPKWAPPEEKPLTGIKPSEEHDTVMAELQAETERLGL